MNILNPALDRLLSKVELTEALCLFFKVSANEIVIVKNVEEAEVDESIRILCVTYIAKAQYPLIVEIFLRDYSLIPDSEAFVIGKLCDFLKCRALVSDDSIDPEPLNPYSWIVVKGDQDFEHVYISYEELEAYDNPEEYEMQ